MRLQLLASQIVGKDNREVSKQWQQLQSTKDEHRPLRHNIQPQIHHTCFDTYPLRISWGNLIKDQSILPLIIILIIFHTCNLFFWLCFVCVVVQFYTWSNLIFLCFKLVIIHYNNIDSCGCIGKISKVSFFKRKPSFETSLMRVIWHYQIIGLVGTSLVFRVFWTLSTD